MITPDILNCKNCGHQEDEHALAVQGRRHCRRCGCAGLKVFALAELRAHDALTADREASRSEHTMKTLHLHMTLRVPDHVAEKSAEIAVLDLKRAIRIFGIVEGVSCDVEEEEVVILDAPRARSKKGRRE